MSVKRLIDSKFWSDSFVVDKLNPLDRYLFLYLLTNEKTNLSGVYELPLRTIANETGIEKEEVTRMLERLKGKVEYQDGWICLVNFTKHQNENNGSIIKGIENRLKELPEEIRKWVKDIRKETSGIPVVDESYTSRQQPNLTKPNLTKDNTVSKLTSSLKKRKIQNTNDEELFTLNEFIESMRKSPQKHIQIIGEYADEKKPAFNTKGQWREFTNRNLKVAKQLSVYSMEQIGKAFELMEKDIKTSKNPKGFITKWGLETVSKYLI